MGSKKVSISMSPELYQALECIQEDRNQDRSSLIEMLLREHPLLQRKIRHQRRATGPPPKPPRTDTIQALARTARRQWEKREAQGEVSFLDR